MQQGNDWLSQDYQTLFRLTDNQRIERENDPDCSPGPRFWSASCAEGTISGIRTDVPEEIANRLQALAITEPPFTHPAEPKHLDLYLATLAPARQTFGLIYELPHNLSFSSSARLVSGETEDGHDLLKSIEKRGMPAHVASHGFHSTRDFWAPWCVATVDGEIASIAFAARLSDVGAEIGVTTMKVFRGKGFAAAVTAAWSRLESLQSRTLFYSADRENLSSQRVAERLGLRQRGSTLRID